ncbi:acyltransferase family protein [Pseudomonas fluorescens]|uniref:O-acetyltransferase OatA n=1 Tax=Pseudomonas fluorescens TaxID=294 RepID=A0A5E7A450_PSEFL|nr:acyltransferase [Pseudomonas fluorescens]VVN70717.1 O-acetyltransferase OatA [Pseudomonas fluorescens]
MSIPIPQLTSLRFFAAAMIVIQHSASYFHIWEDFTKSFTLIQGVTFFFVLSGFILTYVHSNLSGAGNSVRFIWARIARVWPAHFFTMGLLYLLWVYPFATGLVVTTEQTLLNATLTQAWSQLPSNFFAFNGVAWTLSVEMFFYAMFPLLILNFSKTWHVKLAISFAMAMAAVFIAVSTNAPPYGPGNVVTTASWVYIWPPARLFEFVLGMVAGKAFLLYGAKVRASGFKSLGLVALLIIILSAYSMPEIGWALEGKGLIGPALKGWITVSSASIFFALGLFLLASSTGVVASILGWRPLVLLGEISFSIYLIHQIVIRSLMINPTWTEGVDPVFAMIGYWAFTIAASSLLWVLIEKPCQRAMLTLIKRKPALNSETQQV